MDDYKYFGLWKKNPFKNFNDVPLHKIISELKFFIYNWENILGINQFIPETVFRMPKYDILKKILEYYYSLENKLDVKKELSNVIIIEIGAVLYYYETIRLAVTHDFYDKMIYDQTISDDAIIFGKVYDLERYVYIGTLSNSSPVLITLINAYKYNTGDIDKFSDLVYEKIEDDNNFENAVTKAQKKVKSVIWAGWMETPNVYYHANKRGEINSIRIDNKYIYNFNFINL